MAAQNNIPVKDAGTWRASQPFVRISGTWTAMTKGFVRIAGVWTQFYEKNTALAVTANYSLFAALYASRSGAGSLTTAAVTASATGGSGSYTYSWARLSGNSYTVNSPAAAATTFTTTVTAGQLKLAVYRVTANDGLTTAFFDVEVDMESL
jgi:hypothetical protein